MKNIIYITSIVSLSMALWTGCKDECLDPVDPECENYDPCFGIKPANADFTINEQLYNTDFHYETDTIYSINGTLFKPKYDADTIIWILGNETVHQKELFRTGFPEGRIVVTMVAKKSQSACLSEEQRIDTVTKRFFVLPFPDFDSVAYKASPWWGTWEGSNTDEPNEKFTVSWGYIKESSGYYIATMDFTGLPKGIKKQIPFYTLSSARCSGITVKVGYKAMVMYDGVGQHWDFTGFNIDAVCNRENDNVIIDYSYNDNPYQRWLNGEDRQTEPISPVSKTFKATKISNEVLTE